MTKACYVTMLPRTSGEKRRHPTAHEKALAKGVHIVRFPMGHAPAYDVDDGLNRDVGPDGSPLGAEAFEDEALAYQVLEAFLDTHGGRLAEAFTISATVVASDDPSSFWQREGGWPGSKGKRQAAAARPRFRTAIAAETADDRLGTSWRLAAS